mgnify:CR=1 FL=1
MMALTPSVVHRVCSTKPDAASWVHSSTSVLRASRGPSGLLRGDTYCSVRVARLGPAGQRVGRVLATVARRRNALELKLTREDQGGQQRKCRILQSA